MPFNDPLPRATHANTNPTDFSTTGGDVSANLGSLPAYLDLFLSVEGGPAPTGYSYIGFNQVTGPGHNFTFTSPDNYLQFPAANASDEYIFAVCPADIYDVSFYVDTLVYRAKGTAKNATCTDVMVKAVF